MRSAGRYPSLPLPESFAPQPAIPGGGTLSPLQVMADDGSQEFKHFDTTGTRGCRAKQLVKIYQQGGVPAGIQQQTIRPHAQLAFDRRGILQDPVHQDLPEVARNKVPVRMFHLDQNAP